MLVDEILECLDENDSVIESYVLIREIKAYLSFKGHNFSPQIKIKIYKSTVLENMPYHFDVSHHAHTPEQAAPYYTSRTSCESEKEAIRQAISTTTSFIKSALSVGHEPSDSWLVKNESF